MSRVAALLLLFGLACSACALDLLPSFDPVTRRLLKDRAAVGFVVGIVKDGETQVVGVAKGTDDAIGKTTAYLRVGRSF